MAFGMLYATTDLVSMLFSLPLREEDLKQFTFI